MTEYVPDESSEQPVGTGRPPAIFLFQPHTFRQSDASSAGRVGTDQC